MKSDSHPTPDKAPIHVGVAGWDYKDWQGTVYPSPKPRGFDPLVYLSRYFNLIELNTTFYGPGTRESALGWAERVSGNPRFQFTAKLWQRFTHQRAVPWTAEEADRARPVFDALQEHRRLGAVLIQFPWSFKRDDDNREWLHNVITEFQQYPLVVEVRHLSWNNAEFFSELLERGVGIVNVDQPLFSNSIKPGAKATSAVAYVRLHGRNYQDWWRKSAQSNHRYDYLYRAEELQPWVKRVRELAADSRVKALHVVTNNHNFGKAPANALMLDSMLENRPVPGPPQLFQKYKDVLEGYVQPAAIDPSSPQSSLGL